MSLKIQSSNLLEKTYLEVHHDGVTYCKTTAFGGGRKFSFSEIDCVLLSPKSNLSFQVGTETFSIPVNSNNENDKTVVNTLLSELRRAASGVGG